MKWNSALYDGKHDFVSKYGEGVIELLAPKSGERILDLGCGTGDLAATIAASGATVIGVDNSQEMTDTAQEKYPQIRFDVQSATSFSYDAPFDAVFSNATLHWILEPERVVQQVYRSLKNGGRFVAEFGGKGNVSNIVNALRSTLEEKGYARNAAKEQWYFPSLSAYTTLLENNGFRVRFAAHFERETPLKTTHGIRNWIQMFAQSYLEGIPAQETELILSMVEDKIKPTNFKNDTWYADYVRLRFVAIKQL